MDRMYVVWNNVARDPPPEVVELGKPGLLGDRFRLLRMTRNSMSNRWCVTSYQLH